MRTRAEARRQEGAADAAAVTPYAALLAVIRQGRAPEVEAALAGIGKPGSVPLRAALARNGHAMLRTACLQWPTDAVAPLLRAYGEAPDALAGMARAMEARNFPLWLFAKSGHAGAAAALLGAYRRAGRAREALAADDHRALRTACASDTPGSLEVLRLLLDEYGEPGCDAVLAALAARGHGALGAACFYGSAPAVALLAAAYGSPAALRERWWRLISSAAFSSS
jgi:hypothetical protein